MKNDAVITKEVFVKRLVDLCVRSGMKEFPKSEMDQHILFKSMMITMGTGVTYTEKEINQKLSNWIDEVGGKLEMVDFGTLRRWLVDNGYLTRNREGSAYQVAVPGPASPVFEDAVSSVDPVEAVVNGRAEIERRKREYMEKAKKG